MGVLVALMGAFWFFGFPPQESASIGIIGGAECPASIFLAASLAPHLLGAVAADSCLSLPGSPSRS